jgi:hypothetical protein
MPCTRGLSAALISGLDLTSHLGVRGKSPEALVLGRRTNLDEHPGRAPRR